MRHTFTRDQITPQGATLVIKNDMVEVSTFNNATGSPCAIGYIGKSNKPAMRFRFKSEGDRDAHVQTFIKVTTENLTARKNAIAERRIARKVPNALKEGDILYTSWGYDQTNINFYQVVKVVSDSTVQIREIKSKHVPEIESRGCDYVVAEKDAFLTPRYEGDKAGTVLTKRVCYGNQVKIKDYATASLWDGKPQYETALGWGH